MLGVVVCDLETSWRRRPWPALGRSAIRKKLRGPNIGHRRSQWSRGLRRGSAAARLLGLRVRIPPGAWTSVSCEYCLLSGRGLCVRLITRPEESYRILCVWVSSWVLDHEKALTHYGCCAIVNIYIGHNTYLHFFNIPYSILGHLTSTCNKV